MNLEIRIALERLLYLQQIRAHVLASFGPGQPRDRLFNSHVTRYVASRLDREPSSSLGHDVIQAMRSHGWRYVTIARQVRWKGMKKL